MAIMTGIDHLPVLDRAKLLRITAHYPIGFVAQYLSSPCQRRTRWSAADVRAAADIGLLWLPIYVGSNHPMYGCETSDLSTSTAGEHAREAAATMAGFGWPSGESIPCVLDMEYDTSEWQPRAAADYSAAWMAELDRLGYLPTLYGGASHIKMATAQLGGIDHQVWLADWSQPTYAPQLTAPAILDKWGLGRYWNRGIVQYASEKADNRAGYRFDWNIANAILARQPNS